MDDLIVVSLRKKKRQVCFKDLLIMFIRSKQNPYASTFGIVVCWFHTELVLRWSTKEHSVVWMPHDFKNQVISVWRGECL